MSRSQDFPTMSADSVSNTFRRLGQDLRDRDCPAAPTQPDGHRRQAGPQVSLTWRDNANNETGFVVERCTFVAAPHDLQQLRADRHTAGPRNNTGNVTYVDTTVTCGNSYLYQVAAFNGAGRRALRDARDRGRRARDSGGTASFTVAVVKANGNNYTATLNWAAGGRTPANFTIQRATNLDFTTGLTTLHGCGQPQDRQPRP